MIDNELVAQIAKAIQVKTGGNVEGKIPKWWAEFIGMVLAELQSTGRLIPAGGMALTAEQVEDVRALVWLDGRRNFDAFHRLRALFPATEPAEVSGNLSEIPNSSPAPADECQNDNHDPGCGCGAQHWMTASDPAEPAEGVKPVKFRKMTPKYATANFGFPDVTVDPFTPFTRLAYKDSDGDKWVWNGDQWELHVVPPAPAEPAEEETKAEDYCCHPKCRWSDWGGINRKHERGADCPIVPKPTSSPVVPTPTETGPWQRIEDVPDGVEEVSDCDGHLWWLSRNVVEEWHFDGTDPSGTKQFKDPSDFAPLFAIKEES